MVTFEVNVSEGRGDTHGFSLAYNGEAGAMVAIRDTGDAWGRSSAGSGGKNFSNEIHRDTAVNRSTVGSIAADI